MRGKFDDVLADRAQEDKDYFLRDIKKHLRILQEAVAKSLPLAKEDGSEEIKGFTPTLGVLAYAER